MRSESSWSESGMRASWLKARSIRRDLRGLDQVAEQEGVDAGAGDDEQQVEELVEREDAGPERRSPRHIDGGAGRVERRGAGEQQRALARQATERRERGQREAC